MSQSVEDAHTQWLEQLAAMRKAIAELNISSNAGNLQAYGEDLDLDDYDFSGTASSDDIWDVISNEYEEDSGDGLDRLPDGQIDWVVYNQKWLTGKCNEVARSSSGLDASILHEQISAMLISDSNGELHPFL